MTFSLKVIVFRKLWKIQYFKKSMDNIASWLT